MYNVAIIGAGPAGIFAALEIMKLKPDWKVVLIEKGQRIEKRKCPIREGSPKCVNCKRCGLLCGWGGAGAFSGAIMGGMGCGFILFRIFLWGLGIMLLLWLFGSLFG